MPRNQNGADKSYVRRADRVYRDFFARARPRLQSVIVLDRASGKPVMMASAAGGMV